MTVQLPRHDKSNDIETVTRRPLLASSVKELPAVSVLVASHNEEKYIRTCLDALVASEYPKEKLEVLVIDGMSDDRTRQIVAECAGKHAGIRLVDNPARSFPAAMNAGIRNASGEVILITSAHSRSTQDYVSDCIHFQREYKAENVGGVLQIKPGCDSAVGRAIALVLSSRFGSGNAYVKTGARNPIWADSAAFGCYRREVFDRIGFFNEHLVGSSDLDFNRRLLDAGGRILLVPDIVVQYFADPNLRCFWKHNFADGLWATYVLKFKSRGWSWRHWVPLVFVLSLFGSALLAPFLSWTRILSLFVLGSYCIASLAVGAYIAFRERAPVLLATLPLAFAFRHLAHGLGALYGLILVVLPGNHWKGRRSATE